MGDKSKKKDLRQVMRAKQLFKYRVQHFKTIYGPSLNRQAADNPPRILDVEGTDELSKEQNQILAAGQTESETHHAAAGESPRERAAGDVRRYPATLGGYPGIGRYTPYIKSESPKSMGKGKPVSPQQTEKEKPGLHELMREKQSLCQELRVAQMMVMQINQMVFRNHQLRQEKQGMQAMKDALSAEMDNFTKMKDLLLSNHKDLETKCNKLVSSEAKQEREMDRKKIDALQDMLTSMGCDQKRIRLGFQDHFKELASEFQDIHNEMEVNDKLIQERQQQFREYQALAHKFYILDQKMKDMDEKLKATRAKFEQVQISLASDQNSLTETTEEKENLEHERDTVKGEWIKQEQLWGIEKYAMAEGFRTLMRTNDKNWMKEREDMFAEKKVITENLFTAQNRREDLDDELTATKTTLQDERKALRDTEKTLEKCAAENTKLMDEAAEKFEAIVKFKKNMKAKDTEIRGLKDEVGSLSEELDKLNDRKKKKFTLKGVIKKALQKTVDKILQLDVT